MAKKLSVSMPARWSRGKLTATSVLVFSLFAAGCATTSGPATEAPDNRERLEQAQALLTKGEKLYAAGTYTEAMQSYLMALDSGVLTVPQQLEARKHLAFIHCVSSRIPLCSEQFQKAFATSEQFELTPAEAGHPIWGPVYRNVRAEVEQRRSGQRPAPAKTQSAAEKAFADGMAAYQAGNYTKAIATLKEALTDTAAAVNPTEARKVLAFSYCLTQRVKQCRAEFATLLRANPKFELSAAEIGHPSWGPSFRAEKAKLKPAPAGK